MRITPAVIFSAIILSTTGFTSAFAAEQQYSTLQHSDTYIYDAWTELNSDLDGDSYYQNFTLFIHADTHNESASLYAKIYLKGSSEEAYLATTDTFTISSDESSDHYEFNVHLVQYHSRDYYQVIIDLYDANTDEFLSTYSNDPDLWDLPLESESLDVLYTQTLSLFEFDISPIHDYDADGYSRDYNFYLDLDINTGSQTVYVELLSRSFGGHWEQETITHSFTVSGQSSADSISMDIQWTNGHYPDEYEFMINVYSLADNSLTLSSRENYTYLLESNDYDHSEHYVGGIQLVSLLTMFGILAFRKKDY
ncbi:MAG: choice-of-anchor H family protein [Pseudomonadales bacterium]|nr:choice-of-anchor H family protein [Pseudomonadales bacterium]